MWAEGAASDFVCLCLIKLRAAAKGLVHHTESAYAAVCQNSVCG